MQILSVFAAAIHSMLVFYLSGGYQLNAVIYQPARPNCGEWYGFKNLPMGDFFILVAGHFVCTESE
jgi:hypothetical protein